MRKNGFTLVELMVVIVIIGILSSVALPKFKEAVERARAREAAEQKWRPGRNMVVSITQREVPVNANQDTVIATKDSIKLHADTIIVHDTIHDTIKINDTTSMKIKSLKIVDINGVNHVLLPINGKTKAIPVDTSM